MDTASITSLIIEYRYWILIPLSFIEGPIVAFSAGALAANGLFNVYFLAALFFVRDLLVDLAYYSAGYFGRGTRFARRGLEKIGVTPDHIDDARTMWVKHPGRIMFVGKLSYGIAVAFTMAAGLVRVPLRKFLYWGSVVAIVEYGTLLVLGYFFGNVVSAYPHAIERTQLAIAGVALFLSIYYGFSWYMRRKAETMDE